MKKRLIIFILMLLCFSNVIVHAESQTVGTTTDRCRVDEAGNVNIVWTNKIEEVGETNITYCAYELKKISTKYFKTNSECVSEHTTVCGTCTKTSKGMSCTGGSICTICEKVSSKEDIDCSDVTVTTKGGSNNPSGEGGNRFSSQNQQYNAMHNNTNVTYDGGSGGRTTPSTNSNSNSNTTTNNNSNSNGNSLSGIDPWKCIRNPIACVTTIVGQKIPEAVEHAASCAGLYKYSKMKYELKEGDNCNHKGTKEVEAAEYTISVNGAEFSGDTAYCLQPGAKGPDTPQKYKLDTTFNISDCADSLHTKSGGKDVRCGLAHILYETVVYDEAKDEYKSNGKYSYGAITYALRLWMAKYAKDYGPRWDIIGSVGNYGKEFNAIDWVPAKSGNNDYYRNTADKIVYSIENNSAYPYNSTEQGIIICKKNANCSFKKSVELFTSAYNAVFVDKTKFLKGKDFSEEVPVVRTYQTSSDEMTTIVEIPESISQGRTCTEQDFARGTCYVEIRYFDEDGNDITDKVQATGSCGKEFCTSTYKIINLCEDATPTTKIIPRVYIDSWERNNGYIRFYTHSSKPDEYQKMITFAFNLEKCSQEGEDIEGEPTEPICKCPTSTCEDLNQIKDLPTKCSTSNEYTSASVKDPNMNCILNVCYEGDANKFDYTAKYGFNPDVCKVYCRDELEFYLPNKVSVYSGMQFRYDLRNVLGNKVKLKNDVKITSVVTKRKQCTAKINTIDWNKSYNEAVTRMTTAYAGGNTALYDSTRKQVAQLIYDLQNCNLYTSSQIDNPYSDVTVSPAIGGTTSKEFALKQAACENDKSCMNLSVNYDDSVYGNIGSLGKLYGNVATELNNTYYCKNSANRICYQYKSNAPVEINAGNYKSNNLKDYTYKECKNGSCSSKTIKLPDNDYATFIVESEFDFYQSKKYQSNALSGVVTEGNGTNSNQIALPDYSYPVSNSTKTGNHKINFNFSNLGINNLKDYSYSCEFSAYNRTVLYDCAVKMKDGSIDLTNCYNKCYEIKDGIPVIKDECMSWDSSGKSQFGFVYRSVELNNLFPNAVVNKDGISTRVIPINWSDKQDIIKAIESTESDIFTNSEYLQYRYVLTSDTIKAIKEYNKEQNSKGGYTNNTLVDCEIVKTESGYEFRNCKSSFLHDIIKKYKGVEISGNKSGDR